jgi:hypothetical protein
MLELERTGASTAGSPGVEHDFAAGFDGESAGAGVFEKLVAQTPVA